MFFLSRKKQLFLLFLGTFLTLQSCLYAHNPDNALPTTSQKSWSSTLGTAVNTTLYFVPIAYSTYEESKNLFASHQKELIGDQQLSDQTKLTIQKIVAEMGIKETPDIIAMRDANYQLVLNEENADDALVRKIESYKKNAFGVHATNTCIFIDEDIINFETKPELSTFLVKHALASYKKNHFLKTVLGSLSLTIAHHVAWYKTSSLVAHGINGFLQNAGWSSFNDGSKNGYFLTFSRFAFNQMISPTLASIFLNNIRTHAESLYQRAIHNPVSSLYVSPQQAFKLIPDIIKIMPYYAINMDTERPYAQMPQGKKMLDMMVHELCTIALKEYAKETLIAHVNSLFLDVHLLRQTNNIFIFTYVLNLNERIKKS